MKFSLWEYQSQRYRNKGLSNSLLALLLLISFQCGVYKLGERYWNPDVQNKRTFIFVSGCVVHTSTVLLCLLVYLQSYLYKLPWIEKYRIEPMKPWHWERENWRRMMKSTLGTLLKVHLVYFPFGVLVGLVRMNLDFSFPPFWEHIGNLLFCLVMEDTLFYWSHRLFHKYPLLYEKIHKQHHQYDAPFTIAAEYAHPVQYIIGNMIPAASGILILGSKFHAFSYLVFILIRLMNTEETHSGIDIPWSPMRILPLASSPSFHNFHHSKNVGTYGSLFYIWDYLTGTGEYYFDSVMNRKIK